MLDKHVHGFKTIMAEWLWNLAISTCLCEVFRLLFAGSCPGHPGMSSGNVEKVDSLHESDMKTKMVNCKDWKLIHVCHLMLSPTVMI